MTINSTKKIIVFLSVILVYSSSLASEGFLEGLKKKLSPSTMVLSRKQVMAGAGVIGIAGALAGLKVIQMSGRYDQQIPEWEPFVEGAAIAGICGVGGYFSFDRLFSPKARLLQVEKLVSPILDNKALRGLMVLMIIKKRSILESKGSEEEQLQKRKIDEELLAFAVADFCDKHKCSISLLYQQLEDYNAFVSKKEEMFRNIQIKWDASIPEKKELQEIGTNFFGEIGMVYSQTTALYNFIERNGSCSRAVNLAQTAELINLKKAESSWSRTIIMEIIRNIAMINLLKKLLQSFCGSIGISIDLTDLPQTQILIHKIDPNAAIV